MIISEIIGYVSKDAEMRESATKKSYAFFTVIAADEKGKDHFFKCYLYGCSEKRCKAIKSGLNVNVWGKLTVSLFKKDNGEYDINLNLNVSLIEYKR